MIFFTAFLNASYYVTALFTVKSINNLLIYHYKYFNSSEEIQLENQMHNLLFNTKQLIS